MNAIGKMCATVLTLGTVWSASSTQAAVLYDQDLQTLPITNDGWVAINGLGGAGSGNGEYAGGVYSYPNAGFDVPELAMVQELAAGDQFVLADYTGINWALDAFSGGGGGAHLVLKVDGTWYFRNTKLLADPFGSQLFDGTAAEWTVLNLDLIGDTISAGAAAGSDLTGTVEGVGFYNADPDAGFDAYQFTITGDLVPEPASLALLGLGGLLLTARR